MALSARFLARLAQTRLSPPFEIERLLNGAHPLTVATGLLVPSARERRENGARCGANNGHPKRGHEGG